MRCYLCTLLVVTCGVLALAAEDVDGANDAAEFQAMRQVRGEQLKRETADRVRKARVVLATDPERAGDILKEAQLLVTRSDDLVPADKDLLLPKLDMLVREAIVTKHIRIARAALATEPDRARAGLQRLRDNVAASEDFDTETKNRLFAEFGAQIGDSPVQTQGQAQPTAPADDREPRREKLKRLCAEGKWEDAEGYALAMVASDKRASDPKHLPLFIQYLYSLTTLAQIQSAQHKWDEAIATSQKAEEAAKECRPEWKAGFDKTGIMAFVYEQRGIAELGAGNADIAEKYLEQSLDEADRQFPNSFHTGRILLHLSDAYTANGRKVDATQAMRRAIVLFSEELGDQHDQTKQARERLTRLKEAK